MRLLVASMRPFDPTSEYWSTLLRGGGTRDAELVVAVIQKGDFDDLRAEAPKVICVQRGFPGLNPVFDPPSPGEFERLSKISLDPDFAQFKNQVLSMLDRHDAAGAFRRVDREVLLFQLFYGLGALIIRNRITHVFFDITPHVVTEFVIFWLAKKLDLSVLFFQPIPVAGISIPRSETNKVVRNRSFLDWDSLMAGLRGSVEAQIRDFEKQLGGGDAAWVSRYLGPELRKLERTKGPRLRAAWGVFSKPASSNSAGLSGVTNLPLKLERALTSLMVWSHRKSFLASRNTNASTAIPDQSFLLYAMTHEPERTFFPEALPWDSQLQFIAQLAASQQGQRIVLVKEHETQYAPGRVGFASRSAFFYDCLNSLPNVQLVSSKLKAQEIIPFSDGVVSATGTICIEAALGGVPGFYYGSPWWEGFPGTARISPENLYGGDMPEVKPHTDSLFDQWVRDILERSIPSTSNLANPDFAAKFAGLPNGFSTAEAEALSSLLEDFALGRLRD